MEIANELALLADSRQVRVWDPREKYRLERRWWLAVMQHQKALGVDIPDQAIRDYQDAVLASVDLDSIVNREQITRHDVKARLEEFNALAGGWQHAHKGMTGRDLDDNVEVLQIRYGLSALARQTQSVKAAEKFEFEVSTLWLRGIVGPVGTGADMVDLLGSKDKLDLLNRAVARDFYFNPNRLLSSVGQIYPRSLDYQVAGRVFLAVSQIPIDPQYLVLMRGYVEMLGELSGGQWLEGDVSCSVVRRVAIANLFLAASAALDTVIWKGDS